MAFRTFQTETRGQPLPYYGKDDVTIRNVLIAPFSFRGTASRLSYWIMLVMTISIHLTLGVIAYKVMGDDLKSETPPPIFALFVPVMVALFWYQLATFVRRLRDRGWSNTAIVVITIAIPALLIVPMVNILVSLACLWLFIECGFLGSAD